MSGRISIIDAPVVPNRLADSAPKARIAVLVAGVPTRLPLTLMPPATTNSVNSSIDEGEVIEQQRVQDLAPAVLTPKTMMHGTKQAQRPER